MALRFNMLLADEGITPSDVRLLRHQTGKVPGRTPYSLWRDDPVAFERYQSLQDGSPTQRPRFSARYWASFVVPPTGRTLFVGLYEVARVGSVPVGTIDPLSGGPVGGANNIAPYDLYDCSRLEVLSGYVGRMSVHWGDSSSASRAWIQRADNQDKEIVELTREFREEEFPGFTKMILKLSELDTMPASWKAVLRASRGVYLLACSRTREHYVGSAYGADGFLGRWQAYATNNHGGNVGLQVRDPSDFVVSVLEVAGSAASTDDVIALETIWKEKLLSRSIGLNRN